MGKKNLCILSSHFNLQMRWCCDYLFQLISFFGLFCCHITQFHGVDTRSQKFNSWTCMLGLWFGVSVGDVGQLKGSISSNIVIPICSAFSPALRSLSGDNTLSRTMAVDAVFMFLDDFFTLFLCQFVSPVFLFNPNFSLMASFLKFL